MIRVHCLPHVQGRMQSRADDSNGKTARETEEEDGEKIKERCEETRLTKEMESEVRAAR